MKLALVKSDSDIAKSLMIELGKAYCKGEIEKDKLYDRRNEILISKGFMNSVPDKTTKKRFAKTCTEETEEPDEPVKKRPARMTVEEEQTEPNLVSRRASCVLCVALVCSVCVSCMLLLRLGAKRFTFWEFSFAKPSEASSDLEGSDTTATETDTPGMVEMPGLTNFFDDDMAQNDIVMGTRSPCCLHAVAFCSAA